MVGLDAKLFIAPPQVSEELLLPLVWKFWQSKIQRVEEGDEREDPEKHRRS